MNTICWYYDVSELQDPLAFSKGIALLPWEERREKIRRFQFDKDKRLCLGAGLLAAYALKLSGADDLHIRETKNGKQELRYYPDLHFNLSHSGTLAVCAVSNRPIGVDVEIEQDIDINDFKQCFQQEEMAWIYRCDNMIHAFYRLWTRKESYFKRLGTGLLCPPNSISVIPELSMTEKSFFSEFNIMNHQICVSTSEAEKVIFKRWDGLHSVGAEQGNFMYASDSGRSHSSKD